MFIGHFDLEIYLYSTTYIPLPPSHTTHSVGSTGLALWVYAVCGVWGGWVGSFALVAVFFASFALRLPIYQMLRYFNVSCDMSFSWM